MLLRTDSFSKVTCSGLGLALANVAWWWPGLVHTELS